MKLLSLLFALLLLAAPAFAQSPDEAAIRSALTTQVAAWNRGDIPAFMQGYEDSPQTTFVGLTVKKGYQALLERYKTSYANKAQMGTLTVRDIDVRLLPDSCGKTDTALVTGRFHLDRTEHGATSKDDGVFSLVWRKGPHGWKIILDHTS
jgi:uncharacterized protein (TIGR02246 family)